MPRFRPHKMYPGALLAQEACSYQAMTELLMPLRGRLVVLIHSDRDCSNVLPKTHGRIHADLQYKFLCTNLREDEIVTGQGNLKLRRAIEIAHAQLKPDLIVVLSTCPTVMIGDNIKHVARKAGKDLGIRVVAEVTHGLKPKSPAEIVDDCYRLLTQAAHPPQAPDRSRRVNLVGMGLEPDEQAELAAGLAALGLELNVVLNARATLDDFLRVADAGWNVHPGPHLLVGFDEACRERFGIEPIEVPLPFGVAATDQFWRAVGAATGIDGDPVERVGGGRGAACEQLAAFRAGPWAQLREARGRTPRCAYNVGSVRSFDLRRIALEELGERALFVELGFDVALFVQGPQHAENVARIQGVLGELHVDDPFVVFPDPGGLARCLRPGDFDVFFGAGFLRGELTKLNLPLLDHKRLRMGYGSVAPNLQWLHEALTTPFYAHFAATAPVTAPRGPGRTTLQTRAHEGADVRRPDPR